MRLVFFIDNPDKMGGGGYAQYMFARQLAIQGHKVTIFGGSRTFVSEELNVPRLTVFYNPIKKHNRITAINTWYYRKTVIEPWLKRNGADWLIGYMRRSAIKAVLLGKKFGIPVANFVFETPDWIKQDMGSRIEGRLAALWERTKTAYDKSDILIPNSTLAGKKLLEWLPTANVSDPVFPGVKSPDIDNQPHDRDIDIVYVGRLASHKNIDIILQNATPSHNIVIIGKGDELERLKSIAKERSLHVDFAGSISDEEKWNILQRAKLMVFPSKFEGFGMPPLEALACGCHILCSDIPIFREIYGDEVSYFSLDNPEISDQINLLLKTPERPDRSTLIHTYSWENAGEKIVEILKNCEH